MVKNNFLKKLGMSLALISGTLANSGCSQHEVHFVRNRPFIAGVEGLCFNINLQVHKLVRSIGEELDLSYSVSTGDWKKHTDYIKEAYKNAQPIVLVGFSAGCDEVRRAATACSEIEIDKIIFLDPTFTGRPHGKIPSNVREVVCYRNTNDLSDILRGREILESDCENSETMIRNYKVKGTSHLSLPESGALYSALKEEISQTIGKNMLARGN